MNSLRLVTLLLLPIARAQINQQIDKTNPSDCAPNQYFDITKLTCELCGPDTVQNAQKPTECRCKDGYHKVEDYGGLSLRCAACDANKIPTSEGWDCITCVSPCEPDKCTKPGDFLLSRSAAGLLEQELRCDTCRSTTLPVTVRDTQYCAPCKRSTAKETNCDCAASGSEPGVSSGGVCFFDADKTELQQMSVTTIVQFLDRPSDQVDSMLFIHNLKASYLLCEKRNATACNVLGNLCVLLQYRQNIPGTTPNACKKFLDLKNKINILPDLYISDAQATLIRTNLPTSFTFNTGNVNHKLRLIAAVYDANGEFRGWQKLTNGLIQLCPGDRETLDKAYLFGQFYEQKCQISIQKLWNDYETLFFDIKLEFENDGDDRTKLYDIPILNRNYKDTSGQFLNLDKDSGRWMMTRRLLLVDNVSGVQKAGTLASFVQFAQTIELVITVQNTKNGHILPPYIAVSYGIASAADLADNPDRLVDVSFTVTYTGNEAMISRHNKDLEITMGVLCSVGLLWSLLRAWSWARRAGKYMIDLAIVFKFIIYLASTLSDVFFIVMFATGAYIMFAYKMQLTVVYVLLSERQEYGCIICVVVAFILKFIQLLHTRIEQMLTETFFIDWERPRGHVLPPNGEPHNEPSLRDFNQRPATPVTIWRSYLVANEWNELQNYRKTSIALQLILMALFLKVFHFESIALAQPGVQLALSESMPAYATDTRLNRFALAAGLYMLIGFAQWTINVLIVERLFEDHFRNFMDLCSISNISVLALTRAQFGYYIHGRSVHGHADANMQEMNMMLQRERDNLTGDRGLEPNSDIQCFIACLPSSFRKKLDSVRDPLRQGTATTRDSSVDPKTAKMNTVIQVHETVNNYLMSFIEQRTAGSTYSIQNRSPFEAILDVEFEDTSERGIFYRDHSDIAHSSAFLYGNEWVNLSFDCLLFCLIDLMFHNFILAVCVTYVVVQLIRFISERGFTNNLVKSSLVDDRFLI